VEFSHSGKLLKKEREREKFVKVEILPQIAQFFSSSQLLFVILKSSVIIERERASTYCCKDRKDIAVLNYHLLHH
jgi:hypothetical protein